VRPPAAPGWRRSRRIMQYLGQRGLPFERIELESPDGQSLAEAYDLHASPGIVVDGVTINPFAALRRHDCRMDEGTAKRIFGE